MLLVIGAQAAVVRAAPLYGSVVDHGHFGALDKDFAAAAVVIDIVGDEHALCAVFRAALQQEHLAVLENNFAFQFAEARGTDGDGHVVEGVGPNALGHISFLPAVKKVQTTSTTTHKRAARNSAAAPKNAQAKMVLAGCWDDEFGQLPQVETSPKNDPPVSSTAQPKVIRAGKKGERRRGWLGAVGVGGDLGICVMLWSASLLAACCANEERDNRGECPDAAGELGEDTNEKPDGKERVQNGPRLPLAVYFEGAEKADAGTRCQQNSADERDEHGDEMVGVTLRSFWCGRWRRCGQGLSFSWSRMTQLVSARRLRSLEFGRLWAGELPHAAEPAQNVWRIVQQHQNAGPLNRRQAGQDANLWLEEIHAQAKSEIPDHEEPE